MGEVICPGLPASWLNAWLAAVGATVLDSRLRLRWTTEDTPTAVLSAKEIDPVAALADSWPDKDELADMPICRQWEGIRPLPRRVSVDAFVARAQATRGHSYSWTMSSTMTDLDVDENGEVVHAPFDPSVPKGLTLHDRLLKIQDCLREDRPLMQRLADSFMGCAERVEGNGLGFDLFRIGSLADNPEKWIDPVVEILAFFGLALLPMRGEGTDRSTGNRSRSTAIQRGWRRIRGRSSERVFVWPVWTDALDHAGVDALLDVWKPDKRFWPRIGVHAAWQSVRFLPRATADTTRAFGAERL